MIHIKAPQGCDLRQCIEEAITVARNNGESCQFNFGKVSIVVEGDSDVDLVRRELHRARLDYLGTDPVVGPHPSVELTDEEKDNDVQCKIEADQEAEERFARYQIEVAAGMAELDAALATCPAFDVNYTGAEA